MDMQQKTKQFNAILLQRKLSQILLKQSNDPRFERVTITRVQPAPDFSTALVFVSIFPSQDTEELTASLNHASGYLGMRLAKVLNKRRTPKLKFVYDLGFDHSAVLDKTLKKLHKKAEV